MKKIIAVFAATLIMFSLVACEAMPETVDNATERDNLDSQSGGRTSNSSSESITSPPVSAETLPATAISSNPTQWEYRVLDLYSLGIFKFDVLEESMNELGVEGWELVSTLGDSTGHIFLAFFKREIP